MDLKFMHVYTEQDAETSYTYTHKNEMKESQ